MARLWSQLPKTVVFEHRFQGCDVLAALDALVLTSNEDRPRIEVHTPGSQPSASF